MSHIRLSFIDLPHMAVWALAYVTRQVQANQNSDASAGEMRDGDVASCAGSSGRPISS
jgi:hypothetical protein